MRYVFNDSVTTNLTALVLPRILGSLIAKPFISTRRSFWPSSLPGLVRRGPLETDTKTYMFRYCQTIPTTASSGFRWLPLLQLVYAYSPSHQTPLWIGSYRFTPRYQVGRLASFEQNLPHLKPKSSGRLTRRSYHHSRTLKPISLPSFIRLWELCIRPLGMLYILLSYPY